MSLLLDALRKSEKRRNAGSPPPLGLPTGPAAGERPAAPRRRKRLSLFLFALVGLALVIAAAWWLAGRPGEAELRATWQAWTGSSGAHEGSSAAALNGRDDSADDRVEPEHRLVAPAYERPAVPERGPEASPERARSVAIEAEPIEPEGDALAAAPPASARGERLPAGPEPGPERAPVGEPRSAAARRETEASERSETTTDAETRIDPAAPDRTADDAAAALEAPQRMSDPAPVAPTTPAPRAAEVRSENGPEVRSDDRTRDDAILPWELPAGLRSEFPQIDVAVHVFAPDPADRFVLVDGERYGEGDALARGVQLEEIRPRGIVVGFRNYRIRIE